jgi:spermidine synthase
MVYVILACFFVSGACGLVYEVVWSREFVLVLGGTTHAVTAVVAAFMGGLGLGGYLGGRLADRSRYHPVLIYGVLEGGIGALALLAPVLVSAGRPLLAVAYQHLGDSRVYDLIRLALSVLILFPPTLLMGATLPVLVKATLGDRERFGFTAGRLYAFNTTGAVAGAALAGFVLLPALGGRLTIALAAAANFLICGLVIWQRRRFAAAGDVERAEAPARSWDPVLMVLLVGYGLSGLAALIYQIAWTRSLTLTLGGSTYTFSLILTAYIGGLAAGGALMTPLADRIRRPLLWAGVLEFVIGLAALGVLPALDNINLWMYGWVYKYRWNNEALLSLIRFGVAFGTVAVPTLMMGALLPLLARVASRHRPGAAEPMGMVYGANTAGAVVGAFLTGYLLIDLVGVRNTILLASLVSLAVGAAYILAGEAARRVKVPAALAGVLAGAALLRLLPAPDPLVVNSGPYIYGGIMMGALEKGETIREHLESISIPLFFREDAETTVSVFEDRIDQTRSLRINGKTDASTDVDMINQVLLAQFPLLLHRSPQKVMVLGLASGVTAASALTHPIASLDVLELSPAVVAASRLFEATSGLDYQDPRFHLILNDGRNHLALTDRTYDVIISEPSNPWQAAMSTMFTAEFFSLMRRHLNQDGIAVVWIDVYDMNFNALALILRTFVSVFPYVTIWESDQGGDYVLLGSDTPFRIDYNQFAARAGSDKVRADLLRIQAEPADDILARYVMDQDRIRQLVGPGEIHTDDRRQLEFRGPALAFAPYMKRLPEIYEKFFLQHGSVAELVPAAAANEALAAKLEQLYRVRQESARLNYRLMTGLLAGDEYLKEAESLLESLEGRYPSRSLTDSLTNEMANIARWRLANGEVDQGEAMMERISGLDRDRSRAPTSVAQIKFQQGDVAGAERWARIALERKPRDYHALIVLGKAARTRNDLAAEEQYFREALLANPFDLSAQLLLARTLISLEKFDEANRTLNNVLRRQPDNSDAHFFSGLISYQSHDLKAAREQFRTALRLDPNHPSAAQMRSALAEIDQTLGQ